MAVQKITHLSIGDRKARGGEARDRTPPSSYANWVPAADRPDLIGLLEEQNANREPDLVPVRHGRMMVSPFTLYRGGTKIMAADLAGTPAAGPDVQLCGDAHLSNFGVFASATATRSTDRSPTSPSATPTRTSATTSSSSQPSGPDSSPCLRVSEARREGSEAEPAAICEGPPLKGKANSMTRAQLIEEFTLHPERQPGSYAVAFVGCPSTLAAMIARSVAGHAAGLEPDSNDC